jgi:hypothetical protein
LTAVSAASLPPIGWQDASQTAGKVLALPYLPLLIKD